ncbi:sugar ABC transporter ATP-binding protein [Bradyrhizobium prioriisuperbiae]|uniref:sugar ABC transporter ATP-binding protein n=1 Tax=Bradyrhizobium prioriisuperbiae TaxID=2854389 RepID=UPI0028E5BB83|nr:sugar ABC transporter ATP-binding protein [Bradyrhizobium prioritasuperba]
MTIHRSHTSSVATLPDPPRHPLLELHNICKSFPGVKALDHVNLSIWPGEVHMLLGENGAGKSTLMKVLCGAYARDAGSILNGGKSVELRSVADARQLGVAVIFQEFSLVPCLDIAHNILFGEEPAGRLPGSIDHHALYSKAKRVLDRIGFDIDPRTPIHRLGVAQQQMVEIAKALSRDARILVMDEPTAALSDRESEQLFAIMRQLKARGVAIVYISHRMAEVFDLGDRVTVLRDGKNVASMMVGDVTAEELVCLMVGRLVDASYTRSTRAVPGKAVLEVENLSSSNGIRNASLVVRAGEIVGLCGLVGSGRTELARAVFGVDPVTSGEIRIAGAKKANNPRSSSSMGIAFIPENRKLEGLLLTHSVKDNLLVAALEKLFPTRVLNVARANRVVSELVERLRIATPSIAKPVGELSGGNQQKIVIGKWIANGPRLFIFDEPTRGIDIGAKSEIFALLYELVLNGAAVLMISSEQSEIVNVCDRAYVMKGGRIVGELLHPALSEEAIVRLGMHHV